MKKFFIMLAILAGVCAAGVGITKLFTNSETVKKNEGNNEFKIVTSFYPTYIATKNIADGIDSVKVVNLTENHSGCLHDYQLTTNDMRKLEGADVFVMNGGGMESFLEDVVAKYPDLTVIDASKGISLLEPTAVHHHEHGEGEEAEEHEEDEKAHEHDHDHGDNAHVWMDPVRYMTQIENITEGLQKSDGIHAKAYEKNKSAYLTKVEAIKEQLDGLKTDKETEIIIFHEAFAYLAEYLGFDIVYSMDLDDEAGLSAGEIAKVIDEVNTHNVTALFTETEYKDSIAKNISKETGASVYVLSALTSEEDSKDAYLDGMQENINVIKGMLAE